MRLLKLLLGVLLVMPMAQAQPVAPPIPNDSTQLLLVLTDGWQAIPAKLYRFDREDATGSWRPAGAPIQAVVGKKGMGWGRGLHSASDTNGDYRVEFDKRAPAGIFELGPVFGLHPEAQARKELGELAMPYTELKPGMFCIGDHASSHYNQIVDVAKTPKDWIDDRNEDMHKIAVNDEQAYLWGVFIRHNSDGPSTRRDRISGSCIFLHIWAGAGQGTAGCTAMARADMVSVIQWLNQAQRPILVQLPKSEYLRLKTAWGLPEVK